MNHHPVSHVFEILEPPLSDIMAEARRIAMDGEAYTREEFREYYVLLADFLDDDYYRNWQRFWNEAHQASGSESDSMADQRRIAMDGEAYTREEFREYYLLLADFLDDDYYWNWQRFWNEAHQVSGSEPLQDAATSAAVAAASSGDAGPLTKHRRR